MNSIKKAEQLLARIERAHESAINAMESYGRSANSGTSSATTAKHYDRYAKNMELFTLSVAELRALLPAVA